MFSASLCMREPKWNFTFCSHGPPILITLKINTSSLASMYPLNLAVCIDGAAALCFVSSKDEGS